MGLFDLFRRKSRESLYSEGEQGLSSILNLGILFEDNKKLLKWGVPVTDLAKQVEVNEKKFADRTVYNWGEHKILDGLKLALITVYWNHRPDSIDKRFNSIEFLAVGDDNAGKHLRLIGMHLENKFGPGKHVEGEPDGYFEWHINEVRISLYFLQRVANKLHFKIEKI
jgi:hypothetical protein